MNQPYQSFQQSIPQFQGFQYPQQQLQYPYMDRLNQLQSMGMQQQINNPSQPFALGKVVESIDIVKATDIPMDGNMYYFPKADGSEIYAKQWLQNGRTNIITFIPVMSDEKSKKENVNQESFEEFKISLENIKSDLQTLNEKIDKISKTPNNSKTKKEVNTDE